MITDNIKITGDNFEITDAISTLIQKKVGRLSSHYAKYITHIDVLLKIDNKEQQIAEANIHVPEKKINATASTNDMYRSIDELMDKLKHQLEKYKEMHLDHQE